MKTHQLRTLRIIVAAFVFLAFFLIFVDFRSLIPSKYIDITLYLQFIPSAIKSYNTGLLTITAGFLIVIFLTIISGRVYCSFLCPMGIGQDIFSRIGGRFKKRFRRFGYKKPQNILRYSILGITLIVTAGWGMYMITLLDPYSVFGRFMLYFGKPMVISINNLLSGVTGRFDIYTFAHTPIKTYAAISYSIPLLFFIIAGTMSFTKGRFYCNSICPVGSLLGLISKISIFRIRFDDSVCTRCGRCSTRCKSSCIDSINRKFDVSRCVSCFNCINVCQDHAISYGLVRLKKTEHKTDESRRKAVASSAMLLLGIPLLAETQNNEAPKPKKESTVKEDKKFPVCPPGGVSISEFTRKCTACSLCITACTNGVLQPSIKEYGITGFMQPVMNYHKSFCTYKCNICTEICPTNALQPLKLEAKQLTQLGKAIFIKDNCIVKTEKTSCGACSESCPTKAVYMIPFEGNLLIPEVDDSICVGCGHCEFACPTVPFKAIYVDGNPIHVAAKKPEIKESDSKTPTDFPF
ncbi:MAG TPA: 4Fe-4S dicluster domain-containing protein [Bacteroidales bacterium]|nr:4Fe-4S dicluster domain-containing protein [Bacteroidales bacterium]